MKKKIVRVYGANGNFLRWLKMDEEELRLARKRFPKSTFKTTKKK